MKTLSVILLPALILTGCNSEDLASGSAAKSIAAAQNASFEITPSHGLALTDVGGGSISGSSVSNGMGTLGDTSSQPKRVVLTYNLSSIAGKSLKSAKLRIYFDSKSDTTLVTSLGSIRAYKIAYKSTVATSDWNAAEGSPFNFLTSNAAINALAQHDMIEVDILSQLQASLTSNDPYFTVKWRHDTDLNGGTHSFNFYVHYSSGVLAPYIPRIVGEF